MQLVLKHTHTHTNTNTHKIHRKQKLFSPKYIGVLKRKTYINSWAHAAVIIHRGVSLSPPPPPSSSSGHQHHHPVLTSSHFLLQSHCNMLFVLLLLLLLSLVWSSSSSSEYAHLKPVYLQVPLALNIPSRAHYYLHRSF